jgi:hypothetical protein
MKPVRTALGRTRYVARVADHDLQDDARHGRSLPTRGTIEVVDDTLLLAARALVLADLEARHRATPEAVDALEDACANRGWWAEQWPEGRVYVAGLVAQDVQDALFESVGRWPMCLSCDPEHPEHSLYIEPDIGGPSPQWVCEESGRAVAPLGHLGEAGGAGFTG